MAIIDDLRLEQADNYQDAKNIAQNALTAVDQSITNAAQAVQGLNLDWAVLPVPIPQQTVSDTRVAVPTYIPTSDFSNDVRTAFDERFGQLNNDLRPQIESYLEAFFPDINEAIKTSSDNWIIDTIANGRYVPIEVENALYNRARDKEIAEAMRNEESAIEAAGVRGFSTPSGLLNYAIAENQQDLSRTLISINRDITFKLFDVANENTKFAMQMAVSLRTDFVNALGDFIRTVSQQANGATDYARLILQSKTGLHDAAMNLYRGKMEEEKLRTTVGFGNSDTYVKYADVFIDGRSKLTDAEIKIASVQANTAIAGADTLAKVAAGALATRNTMLSVSAGD